MQEPLFSRRILLGSGMGLVACAGRLEACRSLGQFYRRAPFLPSRHSRLWGRDGERWHAKSRLPDYSYAGYHRGECSLPARMPVASVRTFGARGDGKTDDTRAFQRALDEAGGRAIAVPPGRYRITDILHIRTSGTVLVGAGPDRSVLVFPRSLEAIRPNPGHTTSGKPTSNYSWSGGMIEARGRWETRLLAPITRPARRGDRVLHVAWPRPFRPGAEVRLVLEDDDRQTLARHLYAGDPGDIGNLSGLRETWFARVLAVDTKQKAITLDRPLATDVRLAWNPRLFPARSTIEEIGIEALALEFPVRPYDGHFTEQGYNGVAFTHVRNGWIRNMVIRNADSGIFLRGSANLTVTRIVWTSRRKPHRLRHSTGHHGISMTGQDLLLSDFDFQTRFIHDITMSRGSAGNVVRRGKGRDLAFDHHRYANHSNLFSCIDAGEGTNIYHSGGGSHRGRHCGAWTTFWNIRTRRPVPFPAGWAPDAIQVVGVVPRGKPVLDPEGRWFEPVDPEKLEPADLYEAQLHRRLQDARFASP